MRFLAVREVQRNGSLASFRLWGHSTVRWHAVREIDPNPVVTLCGIPCISEAHRTWEQTPSGSRCPGCETLMPTVSRTEVTFVDEEHESG